MTDSAGAESSVEPRPAAAEQVFASRLPLAERFAELLVTDGVVRGLIGPREAERIWTRHLLNCAVVGELLEPVGRLVDVGSGAGLPGLALAISRPEMPVDLVEPLQRRADFLREAVGLLGLHEQVRVVRGRAEDAATVARVGGAAWVTARAVAPLDRLVRWCLPLVAGDGRLVLMKGAGAVDEVERHRAGLRRIGAENVQVETCGAGVVQPPVWVVTMRPGPARRAQRSRVRPRGTR